jgi:alanyl-tRNA synthetase
MFSKEIDRATHIDGLQPTRFLGYDQLEVENVSLIKDFEVEGQRVMVFDQTPMYAEGGGQTGDR